MRHRKTNCAYYNILKGRKSDMNITASMKNMIKIKIILLVYVFNKGRKLPVRLPAKYTFFGTLSGTFYLFNNQYVLITYFIL